LNKGTYKTKPHAQIKTIEQRFIQEKNTGTDKNNWTKVHTSGKTRTYLYICFPLVCTFVQLFLSVRLFPLICTFVQLFLSVRVFSSCLYLCSIVSNTRGKQMYRYKQLNKSTIKKKTHTQMKTIEQRYIQEVNTSTDKNNWAKVHTRNMHFCSIVSICAFVFLLFVPLFFCFYLCVCFLLVCTFVQLFLSVRVFSSIKIIEQRYIQEENTRTDKNKRTKAQTWGKHTHI
jgi:uncharacterized membrane protein (DUF485 family)